LKPFALGVAYHVLIALIAQGDYDMPETSTIQRAKEDLRQGKSPTTAAGEFVHEEIEHIRQGKHGARSSKQAIAIGLSKARRAGVPLKPPRRGQTSEKTRESATRAYDAGRKAPHGKPASSKRSRATSAALKREGHKAASKTSLSTQAKSVAHRKARRAH